MGAKWALTVGAAVTATALAGCGAASSSSSRAPRSPARHPAPTIVSERHVAGTASVVYEWGQFGGGRPRGPISLTAPRIVETGSPYGIGPVRRTPQVVRGLRGTVTQIATSNSDDYALTRAGAVYAWGPGGQGELGDGTRTRLSETAVRVQFPAGVRIASLPNPMPYDGGMAVATDGIVWAWGNDRAREFCQARGSIITTPVAVPLAHVTVAVGALRHALYDTDGRIVSCGDGPLGQLGDGTSGPQARAGTPVAVRGLPAGRAVALTSGWGDAGVLMADGRYYDWGYNRGGQVGDGTTREARTAVAVALPHPVRRVFEGGSFADNGQTLAILDNGTVWEWGAGEFGQLGDRGLLDATLPRRLESPPGVHFVAVNSGGSTNYAIDRHAQLWAWGNNRVDQLGDGSAKRIQRTPVRDPVTVSQVSSTAHNVAALARPASGSSPTSARGRSV